MSKSKAGRIPEAKLLRIYREVLREYGIDTRRLSDAEVKKGGKIVEVWTQNDCAVPRPNKAKALADWQAFRALVNTKHNRPGGEPGDTKPSSDRNRDRHSPGYMREYMRQRRAAQSDRPLR